MRKVHHPKIVPRTGRHGWSSATTNDVTAATRRPSKDAPVSSEKAQLLRNSTIRSLWSHETGRLTATISKSPAESTWS
jgi:hypothetical protein